MKSKRKRVLVTGGAGFIGSHVVEKLLSQGHEVVVIDDFNDYYSPKIKLLNLKAQSQNPLFELVKADIRSEKKMKEVFEAKKFDSVIHLAARAGVRPSLEEPKLYWEVNVMGTLNILERMVEHGVGHLVFASSSSVYGDRDKGPFREEDVTDSPVSAYAASKKAVEELCYSFASVHGVKTVGLRFFTVYGPRNRPDMACYLFMEAVATGKVLKMFGDGSSGRDYTYIEDVVTGIIKAWERPFDFEIFNLGNSSPVMLRDMVAIVERVVGKKARVKQVEKQVGDVKLTFADASKAEKLLGWKARTNLKEGLEKMWKWYH